MRRISLRFGYTESSSHSRRMLGLFQSIVDVETPHQRVSNEVSFLVCMNIQKYWGFGYIDGLQLDYSPAGS
jgi:hypothetical protein